MRVDCGLVLFTRSNLSWLLVSCGSAFLSTFASFLLRCDAFHFYTFQTDFSNKLRSDMRYSVYTRVKDEKELRCHIVSYQCSILKINNIL